MPWTPPRTWKQFLKKVNQYNQEVSEPYNQSWSKVEEVEGLTVAEQALFFSKVENLETAEKLE